MITTAVIGAGPAGLMFCLVGKIMLSDQLVVQLYDKRESYVRTHRLRMAPEPYLAIQKELGDSPFDELIAFLREQHFSPEVNLLEAKLTELLAALGVKKIVREITSLDDLEVDTIVGADSVHSTVRELVRGSVVPSSQVHEQIARLRVTGDTLPERLTVVDQYRLSKVLGSVVDYRLNSNGFAEVDLFLTEEEHALVSKLGASPSAPVPLTSSVLESLKAPLFRAIVAQLESGGKIVVQSTFKLEHAVMPRMSFESRGKKVFLVGDAGVSLPFFRGMACLASCAHALAKAHATAKWSDYDHDAAEIVACELAVVRSRAHLVGILRELIRVSALLPFPIQSWWLSAAREPEPDKLSPGVGFNMLIAVVAASVVFLGLVSPWLTFLSLPIQIGGGVAYRWTLDLTPGPHRYLRRTWEVQIAVILVSGVALAVWGRIHPLSALWWLVLGGGFAAGIYVFEHLVARRLARADLS